jgi:hypothetical protein
VTDASLFPDLSGFAASFKHYLIFPEGSGVTNRGGADRWKKTEK